MRLGERWEEYRSGSSEQKGFCGWIDGWTDSWCFSAFLHHRAQLIFPCLNFHFNIGTKGDASKGPFNTLIEPGKAGLTMSDSWMISRCFYEAQYFSSSWLCQYLAPACVKKTRLLMFSLYYCCWICHMLFVLAQCHHDPSWTESIGNLLLSLRFSDFINRSFNKMFLVDGRVTFCFSYWKAFNKWSCNKSYGLFVAYLQCAI